MIARDLMTPNPLTVTPQASIAEARDVMRELAACHVPVVEPEMREVLGIISYVDVLRALHCEVVPSWKAGSKDSRSGASRFTFT